jgi:hypothetical protein
MSKFLRLIDVLAILILVLFVVSIVTLPWPVNAIIGGVILVGLILIVISDSMAKKKNGKPNGRPCSGVKPGRA